MYTHRTDGQCRQPNRLAELPDNKGWTPLHYACYDNNKKLVQQLRDAGADPNARYTLGEHILLQCYCLLVPHLKLLKVYRPVYCKNKVVMLVKYLVTTVT